MCETYMIDLYSGQARSLLVCEILIVDNYYENQFIKSIYTPISRSELMLCFIGRKITAEC